MSFTAIIPARYASERLPGKLLEDLNGKTVIQRVYECVIGSGAASIIVATDDERIEKVVKAFGGDVCFTEASHQSGTQRIAEVIRSRKISAQTTIVNIQGDEPFMPAACIEQVASLLTENTEAVMATLYTPLVDMDELFDTNVVKVVANRAGEAMYFSRATIPWCRGAYENRTVQKKHLDNTYRHIGIYAYRASFVQKYMDYSPSILEETEKLEQLRVLWYGHKIATADAIEIPGPGIDTAEDLEKARKILAVE